MSPSPFQFVARNPQGQVRRGRVKAKDFEEAHSLLRSRGLIPVVIEEVGPIDPPLVSSEQTRKSRRNALFRDGPSYRLGLWQLLQRCSVTDDHLKGASGILFLFSLLLFLLSPGSDSSSRANRQTGVYRVDLNFVGQVSDLPVTLQQRYLITVDFPAIPYRESFPLDEVKNGRLYRLPVSFQTTRKPDRARILLNTDPLGTPIAESETFLLNNLSGEVSAPPLRSHPSQFKGNLSLP